jgi:hypothetical protein
MTVRVKILAGRIQGNAPTADWDGVWRLTEK